MSNHVDSVSYSGNQREIVENGFDAIAMVLYNGTTDEKRSLLLCLDKYLDPYYGYNLPFANELFLLLQKLLFEPNDLRVLDDIIDLLFFCPEPLTYLQENIERLAPLSVQDNVRKQLLENQ